MAGDSESEVGGAEFVDHIPDVIFYGYHLPLNKADLSFLLRVFVFHFLNLVREVQSGSCLLGLAHLAELLVTFNFFTDVFVVLVDHVDLGVQRVNIVVEAVVLLFSLNKCGHDLIIAADAGFGLNGFESIFDD